MCQLDFNLILNFILAAIALVSVFYGPHLVRKTAKQGFELEYRKFIQVNWITKLESATIDFLNSVVEFMNKIKYLKETPDLKTIDRILDNITLQYIKLQILLDTEKTEQQNIQNAMTTLMEIINGNAKTGNYDEYKENIIAKHESIRKNMSLILRMERKELSNIAK